MEKNEQRVQTEPKLQPKVRVKKVSKTGTSIAIIALSILLGLSLIFGVTAAFFTTTGTATGDIKLGDPVNINITQGGASVTALTFSGTAMPGTVYDQVIGISTPTGTSDCVVRGKLTLTNSGGASVNVSATTDTNWVKGTDDYYYYNGIMSAGDTASFVTSITVPTSLVNADAKKTYSITVDIEAIQFANGAASEVWTTAPATWTTTYGSGTTPTSAVAY